MMKLMVLLSLGVALGQSKHVGLDKPTIGYHERIGIPKVEALKKAATEAAAGPQRIVGGIEAPHGVLRHQAGLLIDLPNGMTSACSGVVISNTRVLTAAHCWFDGFLQGQQMTVVLGSTSLLSGGTRLQVSGSGVVPHADFDAATLLNDIAMITIPWVSTWFGDVREVSLPSTFANNDFAGEWALSSGWGYTQNAGPASHDSLRYVWLNIKSRAECSALYGTYGGDTVMCAGPHTGLVQGPCHQDSGGPLAVDYNNGWIVVGIFSYYNGGGCETGQPAGFTRVTSYLPWITAHLW